MAGKRQTPRWRQREHERFARAVEGGPHSDELADELAVVALLRSVQAGPDQATRDRIRQRVLTAPPPVPLTAVRRISARARLAVAAAAVLCLLMSLAGMSVLLSRDALPGDALYGVKRTAESASLGFVFDEQGRALKHLEFAAARISEIEALAERGAPSDDHLRALNDLDADATEGSHGLTTYGANADGRVLRSLSDWATAQHTRLAGLRPRLPVDVAERTDGSLALLTAIAQRADDLDARAGCSPITSGETDALGPLPAQDCSKVIVDPNSSSSRIPSGQPTPSTPPSSGSVSPTQPSPPQQAQPPSPGGLPSVPGLPPVSVPTTKPGITIPLPLPLPSISLPGLPGISFGS